MEISLGELAERFDCELKGDADHKVRAVATLKDAGPDAVAVLANPAYQSQPASSGAGVLRTPFRDA